MAKIIEEIVVVRLTKLVKDNATDSGLMPDEAKAALEEIVQQLVSDNIVVEIEQVQP